MGNILRRTRKGKTTQTATANVTAFLPPRGSNAVKHLERLRPSGPWVLTAIAPDGRIKTETFTHPERAREFIVETNDRGYGVYYSLNPTKQSMTSKAAKTDIARVEYLHVDADPNEDESPEAFKARMLPKVDAFEPAPTFVIDSGNGLHLLWRLQQAVEITDDRVIADIEACNYALARAFGADPSPRDICRILRLPGTVNYPSAPKREKGRKKCWAKRLRYRDVAYPLAAFTTYAPIERRKRAAETTTTTLPKSLEHYLHHTGAAGYDTKNGLLHAFLIAALNKRIADETLIAACLNPAFQGCAIYEHIHKHSDPRACIVRQIERAKAKIGTMGSEPGATLEVVRLSEVEMKPIRWVWPRRLARGKVTIISGLPFTGKSTIGTDAAARISRGLDWPDGSGQAPLGNAVLLSAEDAIDDTIKPRVVAAGGDPERITAIKMVKEANEARRLFKLQTDLEMLGDLIADIGNVELVVIDPVSAYMGEKEGASITSFRPVLAQLMDFAERTDVGVLIIHHPPKSADKAINAFSGSLAFIAAPRFGFLAIKEAESERRLLLSVGSNNDEDAPGIGFYVVNEDVQLTQDTERGRRRAGAIRTGRIEWDREPVMTTVNEALREAQSDGRDRRAKRSEALAFLDEMLPPGRERDADELLEIARARGIKDSTLKNAKKELGITSGKSGFDDRWLWRRPRGARE
jgi:hypothetical protein